MNSTAFLPGDRVAWYSTYVTKVYSGTVEVVATGPEGDVARVRLDGSTETTVVECARLSLVPDPRPAAVDAALSLIGMLAEIRAALLGDAAEQAGTLASVEVGLSRLLAAGPKEAAR
jgi:hypothetical protein